ncbi:U-box domain-containing protein 52 [Cocos nucifera]|uniref:RING-type E3 ubiquitin transferase n=1 Tax=Cocos nucifera TaxID=13894 RepID=A0A8K0ITW3_COCNU|nr:U-box domain-containing protein 52 [Cocos nucifera]
MHPAAAVDDNNRLPASATLTAVAVDKDKNSQQAVKWTVDHLLVNNQTVILVHVRCKNHGFAVGETTSEANREQLESDVQQLFVPFRGFCARKRVQMKEVILEDVDVSKAIIDYITANHVNNIVVGSSNRNAITKTPFARANYRGSLPPPGPSTVPERRSFEKNADFMKAPSRPLSGAMTAPVQALLEFSEPSHRPPRPSSGSRDFLADDMDFHGSTGSQSMDFGDSIELSSNLSDSPRGSYSPNSSSTHRDLEAEMRRLRLELKQTMDMYSNACKEAISAKQKAKELHQWKMEEVRKFEEARHAEEAALAMAEMEKAKAKAALEAAEAAQRIAMLESQKRLNAEMKAKREAEEKMKALDALAHHDVRYRKYSIEEIEIATDYFSENLKIGEGGYGPVYRASLDHTPVAIKVLRPDAAQGKKQFQQEVEVLSCIRHPNMVLLLGACPEYGCLVYEYMDNGSLEDRLFRRGNTPPIPWNVRFKIAAEIATGLLFLHQSKPEPLVHRDLKPANILLDRNYVSKISDVGLARLVPPSVADTVTQYRMTSTAGTFCYIDPEYQQTGMLGIKSDIYSLGVMLLQLITAKPPMGLSHHVEKSIERGTFREMLDPTVPDWPLEEALGFAKLALKCVELRRKDRPDLGTVILPELNRLRNLGHAHEASHSSAGFGGGGTSFCNYSGPQARARSVINEVDIDN